MWNESTMDWDFKPRRQLNDREQEHWTEIKTHLPSYLNQNGRDKSVWKLSNDQNFTVKSVKYALCIQQPPHAHQQDPQAIANLWKKNSKKCEAFLWMLINDGLLTNDNIQKRLKSVCLNPNWCVPCKNDRETGSHLLLSCQTTTFLWNKANDILRRNKNVDSLNSLVSSIINQRTAQKKVSSPSTSWWV